MKTVAPAIVLTVICTVAALCLAAVYGGTSGLIEEQERLFTLRSIERAIPSYDNAPDRDVAVVEDQGERVCVYRGRRGEEIVGIAIARTSADGYSGNVTVLVGLTPDGLVAGGEGIIGVQVLSHAETPGLGSRMQEAGFRQQYVGHGAAETTFWSVRKDGGEIDQLTGATITSRAVTGAVLDGARLYSEHRDEILSAPAGQGCEE